MTRFSGKSAEAILACSLLLLAAAPLGALDTVDLNNAGVEAYNRGEFEKAITYFEKAFAAEPNNGVLCRNYCNALQSLADGHAKNGNYKVAVRQLDTAISVDPENVSPLIQQGSYYLRMDDVNSAIKRLEQAIVLKPGQLDAHELLGQAYYRDNDLSSARAQWDYVLEMEPNRPGLRDRYDKAFREESVEYDFNRYKSRHFLVSYPPDIPSDMRVLVTNILDKAYVDIGRTLGGVFPPPPIHVILYNAEQFAQATKLADHVGAVYDGKIRSPLTDKKGEWLSRDELARRLTHEYVHVVVRNITGDNVPWWVNEGLAETLSGVITAQDSERLREYLRTGNTLNLRSLTMEKVSAMKSDGVSLAYLKAHAAISLLWDRYGKGKMVMFLQALAGGKDCEEALRNVFRRTFSTLEREVENTYL